MTEQHIAEATQKAKADRISDIIGEAELRRRLPVCPRTIRNLRERGILPFIRLGRRVTYHWPSVEAALLRLQKGGAQ